MRSLIGRWLIGLRLSLLVVLDGLAYQSAGAGTSRAAGYRADRAAQHSACDHAAERAGCRPLLGSAAAGGEKERHRRPRASGAHETSPFF
jgi:hypothetical protein